MAVRTSTTIPSTAFACELSDIPLGKFDIGGVLYHAAYYHLMEQAREALLTHINIPYRTLVQRAQHLTIVEAHQHFMAPIYYGDPVTLYLWADEFKRCSVKLHYVFVVPGADPVHRAWTTLVYVQLENGQFLVRRLPEALRTGLARHGV